MPNLLSRRPFHHEHHHHHEHSPNSKHSRSFLSFAHKRQSNDSIKSDKSTDSLHSAYSPHGQGQGFSLQEFMGSSSPKSSHSMVELKRFLRPKINRKSSGSSGHHHRGGVRPSASTVELPQNLLQQSQQYAKSNSQEAADHHAHTQSAIPPSSDSTLSLSNKVNIYHDDSILAQKYGKLGRVLGSGAGGNVKVLWRPSDNATFAVKEFRPRKQNESVKDYAKKCTAEFCIGSTLRHCNIIETMDIFSDTNQNRYFEVMEYAPVDFFAVVMTGKMSRGEINCCLKQIMEGVKYLHSLGLAHRDLKLDNCVMTLDGILKLIDFGSAVVFRYPMEVGVTPAHGIVGSDPYLAPEVISHSKCYEPQRADIWSIGIIYCCMMLKRFPWKVPKESDENFRLYCLPDDEPHDYVASAKHHEELLNERRERHERQQRGEVEPEDECENHHHHHHHIHGEEHHHHQEAKKAEKEQQQEPEKTEKEQQPEGGKCNQESQDPKHEQMQEAEGTKKEQGSDDTKGAQQHDEQHSQQVSQQADQQSQIDAKSVASHPKPPASSQNPPHHRRILHGPYRLLRLLPHAARPIMSRILDVDPTKRATMKDIYDDDWFAAIQFCTVNDKKEVVRAPNHHHTLVREDANGSETFKV
ncbi:HRK1 (YOR267C) [Zygosaccharomyces parabailii]|nr:HRK1 (YOR267C) [Zygosaccharomyces parabailii]AQZ17813.1 HRK1 (YOR267C) [Zygosaccharomyces parabailii]CDH14515.1 related to HRK1-Protein kinase with a role in ion homeostasis [Zygosaccharomyces bailii ISA1307]